MSLSNLLSRWNTKIWASTLPREPEQVARAVEVPALPSLFEFTAWPKTARLMRDIVITEKLDGTNAAIIVRQATTADVLEQVAAGYMETHPWVTTFRVDGGPLDAEDPDAMLWVVGAQSRNRLISWQKDNQGFAAWVLKHAKTLVEDLGEGLHFGEFWGNKIARGYGLPEGDRRFSLFNPEALSRPRGLGDGVVTAFIPETPGLDVVPVLYSGPFDTDAVRNTLAHLQANGSAAVPGYLKPEGVIVYHTHARKILGKVTLDSQDAGKWEA